MALTNYTQLISAINDRAGWLHRDDLGTIAPDWVTLCETTINMGDPINAIAPLRTMDMETAYSATTSSAAQYVALPTGFLEWRKIFITYGGIKRELRQKPILPMSMSERAGVQNIPQYFWVQGGNMYLDPWPNGSYALTGDYYTKVGPLVTSSTNWLMTAAPMVYLFGSIAHGSPWLGSKFDPTPWIAGFKTGMAQVQSADIRKRGFGFTQAGVEAAYINRGRFNIQTGY